MTYKLKTHKKGHNYGTVDYGCSFKKLLDILITNLDFSKIEVFDANDYTMNTPKVTITENFRLI